MLVECSRKDASYCTQVPANTIPEVLKEKLMFIFKTYRNVIEDYLKGSSLKRLGEELSWISA